MKGTLKCDEILWYKIHVLLYDLCHIKDDRTSETRTLSTTDPLYISGPYFTDEEAERIKSTIVELTAIPGGEEGEEMFENNEQTTPGETTPAAADPPPQQPLSSTIEVAIQTHLSGFLEKRKASGDSRPCGPHDLGPIFRAVFGIGKDELVDERFLARLRRSGLGDVREKSGGVKEGKKGKGGKGGKKK
ncbi:hypothetical protein K402DRAFT_459025 [Aulographum hederae CBS 113979]|uniref:Uncharacterized protein n=1 Tax=Aulographum hederae CBS 113979 TaxID=1176131 RepID=A0A6G1HF32_9PEZI|nr:hypothetical protein K402DRAFT_459025 [Aulographum hederae CBS 113979]